MKDIFGKIVVIIVVIAALLVISPFFLGLFSTIGAKQVKQGDTVKVEYTGTFENGTVFDTSEGREPLEFVAGTGQMIPGFDNAVIGMKVGQEKKVKLQPSEAYGDYDPQLVQEMPRKQVPIEEELKQGMVLAVTMPNGRQVPATVKEVINETITIDLNHPLAGEILNFRFKVVDIAS
ncbi:MAG: peptidylprolyl isomerase [Nanoarchaeota archaeon]